VDKRAAPHSLTGLPWTANEVNRDDAREPRYPEQIKTMKSSLDLYTVRLLITVRDKSYKGEAL